MGAWGDEADPPPNTDPGWVPAAAPPNDPNPAPPPPLGAMDPNVAPANKIIFYNIEEGL